ncbi:MAG: DUF2510 domain-containing protein [bacterium]|nr:DUF2510 domain-containing protein [bacterium]
MASHERAGRSRRAPPGWYSDHPQRGFRYWDGESWAEPMGRSAGLSHAGSADHSSSIRQRTGLAFLGAAVGLVIAGLVLPWAEGSHGSRGVLDGGIPWRVSPAGAADSWLLLLAAVVMLWGLLAALAADSRRMWLAVLVAGLADMGFCVWEGLAIDDGLDLVGARVGAGLFVAYAGGAAAAMSGVLLRPSR